MKEVKFIIQGEPFGKQRPKFSTIGKYTKVYTPKETVSYENLVKLTYAQETGNFKFPDDAMFDVRILAYYGIPKNTSKKKRALMEKKQIRPTKKPDWDNIGKIICDSLNKIAYHDDSNIVDAQVRKFYSEQPRVEVIIKIIGGEKQ